jgi:hypothetical protein
LSSMARVTSATLFGSLLRAVASRVILPIGNGVAACVAGVGDGASAGTRAGTSKRSPIERIIAGQRADIAAGVIRICVCLPFICGELDVQEV